MRIVFWGSERGCYVTSNMLLLAGYLACQKGYRITMLELAEESGVSWECFSRNSEHSKKSYIRTLVERQLYYVTMNESQNAEKTVELIRYLESNMDMVFINLANRFDNEAKSLLHNAHLVVLNLRQDLRAFDRFYARYANVSANILLLIGNYYENGECEKEQLLKKYRIPEEKLAVIPNNPEYEMACARHCVDRYIRRSRRPGRSVMRNQFIKELGRAATQLYEAAYISEKV